MIEGAINALSWLNEAIGKLFKRVAAVLLMIMLVVVMLQVVARYGLNNPISWSEELSKALMVWSAFLVAPFAYREGTNVAIELFADAWPPLMRRISELIIAALILWIVVVFFRESVSLVARGMKVSASSLPVSIGVFYAVLPVSFACLFLAVVERLLRLVTGRELPHSQVTGGE